MRTRCDPGERGRRGGHRGVGRRQQGEHLARIERDLTDPDEAPGSGHLGIQGTEIVGGSGHDPPEPVEIEPCRRLAGRTSSLSTAGGTVSVGPAPPGQGGGPRTPQGQPGPVGPVQPLGVAAQGGGRPLDLAESGPVAVEIRLGPLGERRPDPGPHLDRPGVVVVQIERVREQPDLPEAMPDHIQGGALLRDEQHPAALGQLVGQDVGDRLRLPGAGRTLENEAVTGPGRGDRPGLGPVGRDRCGGHD